jgi:hypothetical protein
MKGEFMQSPQLKFANLDATTLEKVRVLEKKLGTYVIALEPAVRMATLSPEQLQLLQKAEQEFGCVLLAYERK